MSVGDNVEDSGNDYRQQGAVYKAGKDGQWEAEAAVDPDFILWDVERLAAQAVRGGLTGWQLDKAE
jgi:hypothetical protein